MKEFSIEEKAKAYDEAINRMKHYAVDEYGCSRIKVADVFPELKESEEKRMMKEIIDLVMQPTWKTEKEFHRRNELCAWLKKQVEQAPAWSEEDEKKMESIICSIKFNRFMNDALAPIYEGDIRWLKSLKYRVQSQSQWKPSDEQITWLYRAADDASKDSRMKQILNELLSDLKKLRE